LFECRASFLQGEDVVGVEGQIQGVFLCCVLQKTYIQSKIVVLSIHLFVEQPHLAYESLALIFVCTF
jgi:hypothetical protein